jgi:hypothetical protein
MKDRSDTYGVDVGGKRGRAHILAAGGLLVKRGGKSRFIDTFYRFVITWRSQMCTFPGSPKMALSLGAVVEYEETGRAGLKEGEKSIAPFMACLRHNRENNPNGEKSKSV